jgi:glycosyltransferase involved in cell wall biosynthesis
VISVIVAARDEERVVARGLRCMLEGLSAEEVEILVVCNGCSDGTADRAREVGGPVRVVETEVGSKTRAWNLGDDGASGFPRFYVDADVMLPGAAIREVARVLEAGSALAAAPRLRADLAGSSWPVRAFYAAWLEMPYFRTGMIGSGVFALSREGRARFGRFPEIIADDDFVRLHFEPGERRTVESCSFTVVAPARLGALVRVKTRSRLGRLQLDRLRPELARRRDRSRRSAAGLLRRPRLWPALGVYAFVVGATSLRARRRLARGEVSGWERDESSRVDALRGRASPSA